MKNSLSVFCLVFMLFLALPALAQDYDIYTDPLFIADEVYYKPIPSKDLQDEKRRALQEKDDKTMYVLGMMYKDAKNVELDYVQSAVWFKKAAELGNSDAMIELARIFTMEEQYTGVTKSQEDAVKWIKKAEEADNPKAYYIIGLMYEDGFPFEKSYEKAFEYYLKAANKGVLNAYVKIYIAYQYAKGVDYDLKKAIVWLRKIQNEAPESKPKEYAREMLSDIYFEMALHQDEPGIKFKLFNLAWSNGNRYAIEAIGDMFSAGEGVKQNYSSAIVAYETAIKDFESVYAMEKLGYIYFKGPAEIDRDFNKSFGYFKKAADLGGVNGAYMLGYMYYYGLGVDKNLTTANTWFSRSTQLAEKKKKQPQSTTTTKNVGESVNAIKNIISNLNEKEREKQKNDTGAEAPANQALPQTTAPQQVTPVQSTVPQITAPETPDSSLKAPEVMPDASKY